MRPFLGHSDPNNDIWLDDDSDTSMEKFVPGEFILTETPTMYASLTSS